MNLGARIRKIRKSQGRTLENIATACGCTRSLLSKIETGATSPPVATLTRIAAALGVSVGTLVEPADSVSTVFTRRAEMEAKPSVATDKGYQFQMIAPGRDGKLMQPFLFTARKGQVKKHNLSHHGEEFVYMLEGEMAYRVGAITYTLTPGDSLYFDSLDEHEIRPVSDRVKYLAVFSEPAARPEHKGKPDGTDRPQAKR